MQNLLCYLCALLFFFACSNNDDRSSITPRVPQEEEIALDILTDRNDVIWGFDFLPDNRVIFTERQGRMLIIDAATRVVTEVTGEPTVSAGGEGGLLDLKLHPDFSSNNLVYFCYTAPGKATALGRATLSGNALQNTEVIFRTNDTNSSSTHFGCRIEFENSSQLFLSVGDQSDSGKAQDLNSHLGKILRLNDNGSVPTDNPFVNTEGALPEIWSYGHRNPQGLAINPQTQELFSSEHGPVGNDELNVIESGQNYGWPTAEISELPIATWTPAIAPSGITFYNGAGIPPWNGSLFIATLRGEHIRRIVLDGRTVVAQELLFEAENLRFRNVRQGSDGFLWFSTDDGKLGRILSSQ